MRAMNFRIAACLALATGLVLAAHAGWAQAVKRVVSGHGHACQVVPPLGQEDRKVWETADGILHVRDQRIHCWIDGDLHGWTAGYESYNYDDVTGRLDSRGYNVFYGFLFGRVNSAIVHWQKRCDRDGEVSACQQTDTWQFSNGSKADIIWSAELGAPAAPYSGLLADRVDR